jgi:hypothetical protein
MNVLRSVGIKLCYNDKVLKHTREKIFFITVILSSIDVNLI